MLLVVRSAGGFWATTVIAIANKGIAGAIFFTMRETRRAVAIRAPLTLDLRCRAFALADPRAGELLTKLIICNLETGGGNSVRIRDLVAAEIPGLELFTKQR